MTTFLAAELARATGVSTDTLRYYERRGLLPPVPRGKNGYRRYPESAVHRVTVVRRAMDAGFTVAELARILKQRGAGGAPCRQVDAIARHRLKELEERIEDLIVLRDELRRTIKDWESRLAAVPAGQRAGLLETLASHGGRRKDRQSRSLERRPVR